MYEKTWFFETAWRYQSWQVCVCFLLAKLQTGYTKDILHLTILLQKKSSQSIRDHMFFSKKNNKERKTIITPKLSFQKDVLVHQLDVVEYLPTRLPVSMGNPLGRHLGRLKISRQAGQIHHLAADFFGAQLKKTAKWWQHRNFRRSFLIFLLFKKKVYGFLWEISDVTGQ